MERRYFLKGAALGTGATVTTTLAAPAIAQDSRDMIIVSTWPRDFPGLGTSAQRLAKRIEELSNSELRVEYYAAGERVGAFDAFDHVAAGEAQAYSGVDNYWKGKHQAFVPFAAVPFGLTYTEMDAWMKFGGGQELLDEVAGEFGLKNLPYGNTGVQMGGWFNKEIESVDDFKGLKIRTVGDGGDVYAKMGASVVALPGGQIYENLISGAVDAAEFVGPYNDFYMKFFEAAKYYYWPSMVEPGAQLNLGMNRAWWDGLPTHLQNIIQAACNEENSIAMAETNANNGLHLRRMIEEHGIELREFNDDIVQAMYEATLEMTEAWRAHSPLAKRVYDSMETARDEVGGWMKLGDIGYSNKRNRVIGL
ncbi:TRAP-type mannitol/chloroaromatic compound transport system, substrate-binding protein [Roseovarius azorensis]|uniref:TRAP-type mannitol/chloroaromatic compound transport system, substrate-binding protein n=1 Tax=Roseovarius azorensis TaxID=1287727 RepID=A0A1H7QGW3_9RHOB|nr:TRAP transporter substrate-binding protein [Roseovarius azorensis]SEL47039.1 TRAP-type mannitol/chloroaromatic compound transport system, substrate-binding protein [Roseovarius azorensis]